MVTATELFELQKQS